MDKICHSERTKGQKNLIVTDSLDSSFCSEGQLFLLCKKFGMCGDENCHGHDCKYHHHNCNCDDHCHEHEVYNGYNEGDIVGETDFQIVDKDELENMRSNEEVGGNLGDDLVDLGFISEDDEIYKEMKNEKRDGVMYDI